MANVKQNIFLLEKGFHPNGNFQWENIEFGRIFCWENQLETKYFILGRVNIHLCVPGKSADSVSDSDLGLAPNSNH